MPDTPRRRSSSQGEGGQPASRRPRAQSAQRSDAVSTPGTRPVRHRTPKPDGDPNLARAEEQEGSASSLAEPDGSEEQVVHGEGSSRDSGGVIRLVNQARRQLAALTGRRVSSVVGFEPQEDGWVIAVELVELERIPETTSILGCYRARLDRDGELVEYRRVRRYVRSQPDED
jgi:hypothetical protein